MKDFEGNALVVHMIGNAHIDPVWLWNWQAGVDEALATFRSAADRCDEYPEFIYTRGEAWLYEQVERLEPELFARVATLIAQGQWHITGGQYIQPDCNLPTLTGWQRQLEHGQRYFQSRFGVQPKVGYNVDSFGHPATLPDIYAKHGYEGYVFHRPSAKQQALPAQAFRWQGTNSELLGFRIAPAYVTRSDDLYGQVMLAVDAANLALGHTMCFYGVGNHGGGPTKANIEYILEHRHAFEGLELRFSTPQAFFDAVWDKRDRLPCFKGELQHTFPGCYSVMHDVKQAQRQGEHLLAQAESFIEAFGEADRQEAQHNRLDTAWNDLLFTQFHDISAGASIPSAWPSVRAMQGRARIVGEELLLETSRRWSRRTLPPIDEQQLVAMNALPRPWEGHLEAEPFIDFDTWGERWLSALDGTPVPYQRIQPEATILLSHRILFPVSVPAGSVTQLLVRDGPGPKVNIETDLKASATELSNAQVSIELAPTGIKQLSYRGEALLGGSGIGLHLREDHTDTWTFHRDRFTEPVSKRFSGAGWVVEETGPLRARARLEGQLGHSAVRWTVSLYRDEPRVHFRLEVVFNERFKLLQLPINLKCAPETWTDAQAGGYVRRSSGPVEWPVQRWSRLEFADYSLALLTHDAYSLSLDEGRWQWTLLRSPIMAWSGGEPDIYAGRAQHSDQGLHTFAFVLEMGDTLSHEGLDAQAAQLAHLPIIFDRYEGMQRPPWRNDVPRRLWTGAEQRARQDGRMMHLADDAEKGVEE